MSFLQPLLLAALPLVALPIVIHLINQRRYQTIRWAAMMFLLAANRMSRGYAKLRQWLILLFRMAVVAALIFAVSRPLASGWVGLAAGGKADTTIVLLDRSPSMQQSDTGASSSKLDLAKQQLAATLPTLGSSRWVLIDSVNCKPIDLDSPAALLHAAEAGPASASADLPAMLQAAFDYVKANRAGRTEIWICSDLRASDWNDRSSRWESLRSAFLELKQSVRFHLHAFTGQANGNLSVRVTGVRRIGTSDGAELLVSLHLAREGNVEGKLTVPLQFEIDGARSQLDIEMTSATYDLKDHSIPLGSDKRRGSGKVSIPADLNPADNDFYFAYDEPPARRTIIVADDPRAIEAAQLAAEIHDDPTVECQAEIIAATDVGSVEWEKVSLLLWQAPLPQGEAATAVQSFIARGGQAIFFPPNNLTGDEFCGVRWETWDTPADEISVENWTGDHDLLAHTQSGAALPVGDLHVRRYCRLGGQFTTLATLAGSSPFLVRATTDHGGAYFCATTASPGDSSLATDGVVLFVAVQRALAAGTAVLGNARQIDAGEMTAEAEHPWKRVAGAEAAVSTEYPAHAGVFSVDEKTLAVNRSESEDETKLVAEARVSELFKGLNFELVEGSARGSDSLTREIWRMFLIAMMAAMVFEAALCLPKLRRAAPVASVKAGATS
jgi:hypothetical protein